jgi:hypothetical protein
MKWRCSVAGCALTLAAAGALAAQRPDARTPPPTLNAGFASHLLADGRTIELHAHERVVFALGDGGKLILDRVMAADAPGVTLDSGQIAMNLMPAHRPGQAQGTELVVRTALSAPLRYHALLAHRREDGALVGYSTPVCPAQPRIFDVENWPQPVDVIIIFHPELAAPGDTACRD